MKRIVTVLLSGLIFLLGLCILLYPTASNWLNQRHASHAMKEYFQQTDGKSSEATSEEFDRARAYNSTLTGNITSLLEAADMVAADQRDPAYWDSLDAINGMMGVVEIPSIEVSLPIYHGTAEPTLQKGVGHLEGTALPTGDVGTHTVLTGHTGLPTAQLFTDLDMVEVGDTFQLEILDQVFDYEVKNIYTVLPTETAILAAQPDKNLVTLVTCTPYGINSHRLLVQGERVEGDTPVIPPVEELLEPLEKDVPLALQNIPILIGGATVLALLFLGAIVYYLASTRYEPKRIKK